MTQCAWEYVDGSNARCKHESLEGEAMCKEHNEVLDTIFTLDQQYVNADGDFESQESFEEYNRKWEAEVKRSNEIGRD